MIVRRDILKTIGAAGAALGSAKLPVWAQAGPRRGGTLNVVVQPEPATLNLAINQQTPTNQVAAKMFLGLFVYGFDLKPIPNLVESWETSPDGLTYTFKLHRGITWHDGAPFTAADVIFSYKTMLVQTHSRARTSLAVVGEYAAPDDHTVVIQLKQRFAPFIYALDLPIMPRHIFEGKDFRTNPANQAPIGLGPFKFKEWRRGEYIHLVRNENYFKPGLPYLDEIYFRVILDASTRLVALESGQVHLASFTDVEPIYVPQLMKNPALEVTHKGYEFLAPLAWLEINNRVKPLDDKRMRQAIMHAIDRNFLKDKIWFGQGKVASSPISSLTNFYDPTVPTYDYNPAKAEALLDEMGLKRGSGGVRARFKLLQFPYGLTWTKASEFVKQQLSRVGIDIDLEATDAGGWAQRVSNWDYELTFNYVLQFADPALGVSRTYVTSNIHKGVPFSNTEGYSNPRVDELCDKAAAALDPEERRKLYAEVQRILIEDVPVAWLLELQFPTVYNRKLKDIVTTGFGTFSSLDVAYMT